MPAATPGSDGAAFYTDQRTALLSDPSITEKKMFGTTALFVVGKLFMFPWKEALVVKIPAARVDELITSGQARLFDPGHGRTSSTWASVFVSTRDQWPRLAQEAQAFVQG